MSCEYGLQNQNSIYCNLINDNCTFTRWCYNSQCIKNTNGYINCKVRSGEMSKKKKIEAENIEFTPNEEIEVDSLERIPIKEIEIQQDFLEEYCNVLWKKTHAFAFEFHDYGISVHVKDDHILDTSKINDIIKIKYKGQIGTPSFEYYVIYE